MDHPLTEGTIRTVYSLSKALAIFGWKVVISDFGYRSARPSVSAHDGPAPNPRFTVQRISMPILRKERLISDGGIGPSLLAATLETLMTPRLISNEKKRAPEVIHITNCFKYSRFVWQFLYTRPLVLHLYQREQVRKHLLPLARSVRSIVASSCSVSQAIQIRLGVRKDNIVQIYPPVDTDLFCPTDKETAKASLDLEGKKVILYMGNLDRRRFPDAVISLLKAVFQTHKDLILLIATTPTWDNIERAKTIQLVSKHCGLQRNIRLIIRNLSEEEKVALYGSSELFLFAPSTSTASAVEPPLTVMESLSMGVPVVATDVLSTKEVITHDENGFCVPVSKYNDIPLYVDKLLSMSQERRDSLSASARRTASEAFSLRKACKQFGELHERLIT
jgi:glycosyltransferase involved in cell wall biosynthesis